IAGKSEPDREQRSVGLLPRHHRRLHPPAHAARQRFGELHGLRWLHPETLRIPIALGAPYKREHLTRAEPIRRATGCWQVSRTDRAGGGDGRGPQKHLAPTEWWHGHGS